MEAYGGENSGDEATTWCFTYNPEFPTQDLDWGECVPFSQPNIYNLNPVTVLPDTDSCSEGANIMTSDPNGATGGLA